MTSPVTIRGVTYPTQTAAAKALGVWPAAITRAKALGTLDFAGLGKRKCPVRVRGVDYPSQEIAARAFGVTSTSVRHYLDKGKIDELGQ